MRVPGRNAQSKRRSNSRALTCDKRTGMRRMPGILWIAAGAALWGTDTVFRRPLTGVLGSTQIVLYEHLILALVVLPIVIRERAWLDKISFSVWAAALG